MSLELKLLDKPPTRQWYEIQDRKIELKNDFSKTYGQSLGRPFNPKAAACNISYQPLKDITTLLKTVTDTKKIVRKKIRGASDFTHLKQYVNKLKTLDTTTLDATAYLAATVSNEERNKLFLRASENLTKLIGVKPVCSNPKSAWPAFQAQKPGGIQQLLKCYMPEGTQGTKEINGQMEKLINSIQPSVKNKTPVTKKKQLPAMPEVNAFLQTRPSEEKLFYGLWALSKKEESAALLQAGHIQNKAAQLEFIQQHAVTPDLKDIYRIITEIAIIALGQIEKYSSTYAEHKDTPSHATEQSLDTEHKDAFTTATQIPTQTDPAGLAREAKEFKDRLLEKLGITSPKHTNALQLPELAV